MLLKEKMESPHGGNQSANETKSPTPRPSVRVSLSTPRGLAGPAGGTLRKRGVGTKRSCSSCVLQLSRALRCARAGAGCEGARRALPHGSRRPAARTQSTPRLSDSHKWPGGGPRASARTPRGRAPRAPAHDPSLGVSSFTTTRATLSRGRGGLKPGQEATRGPQPLPRAPPPPTQPR